MKEKLLIIVAVCTVFNLHAQTDKNKDSKVITIEKKIDKDGNEVIEKKVLEGDAAKKAKDIGDQDDRTIQISTDSNGVKKKIIIKDHDVQMNDDQDRSSINFGSDSKYTDRTVVIQKNADGTVTVKEASGANLEGINVKVDSTQSKKPVLGLAVDHDMRISRVLKGGPAEIGGLQIGDVLTHIDDTFIEDSEHLQTLLAKYKVGDKVNLTYLRDRKEMKSTTTLKGGSTRVYFNRN